VFTRTGGAWTQQGSKLVGTGAIGDAKQGSSVSLSADGNTAVIGGPSDGNGVGGAVWVFTRSNGAWSQQGSKLVGLGSVGTLGGTAAQGTSVGLSADGNTAIAGGDGDGGFTGAAWVFTRSNGTWTQQGGKLVGTGATGAFFINQGRSVALSADGNTAVIGGSGDTQGVGAAWVFTRSGGAWTQSGSKLVGTGSVAVPSGVSQGGAAALSADGNTALVGGFNDNAETGAAWVFTRNVAPPGPTVFADGVVNSATFQQGMSPNSWITIQGTNLSATTDTWDKSIQNGALPTMLDGVSVNGGGKPAYIQYVSQTQINALAPDIGPGSFSVTITNANGTSAPVNVVSQSVMPGFFLWAGKYAVATRQDFSWAVKNGTFQGVTTTPAKPGDVIILWGTGFGPTNPAAPVGMQVPADKTYSTAGAVGVTVGGTQAQVYGAALAPGYAGLYQVAIQIPPGAQDGDLAVVATIGGVQSATALITVQH
jgi:uncharacterized protein (TIGR03437 family)